MTEIQYFRLSSAAQMLGTSEDIILDYAEQGSIVLSAMCRDTWGVISQGYRNGTATALFIGYGNLNKTDVITIASKGKADISVLGMTQHCVQGINHKYPFKVPVPNNLFDVWQMPIPDPEKKMKFYFHIKPYERTSDETLISAFENIFKPSPDENKYGLDVLRKNQDVYAGTKKITKDELRISSLEIEKLRSYLFPKEIIHQGIVEEPKRPMAKLLTRVLQQFPNEKSSNIWRMLQEDLNRDERLYDIDEILDEVGSKELYWSEGEKEANRLTQQSFYNLVKELRENST